MDDSMAGSAQRDGSPFGWAVGGRALALRGILARRAQGRWFPVVAHGFLILPPFIEQLLGGDPATVLVTGGIMVAIGYPFLALIKARRAPLLVSPLSFYFALYTVNLGLSALYMAHHLDSGYRYVLFGADWVTAQAIPVGYLLYLAGSLAFHAGITFNRPIGEGITRLAFLSFGGYAAIFWIGTLGAFGLIDRGNSAARSPESPVLGRPWRRWRRTGSPPRKRGVVAPPSGFPWQAERRCCSCSGLRAAQRI